jgi:hypothetical protein
MGAEERAVVHPMTQVPRGSWTRWTLSSLVSVGLGSWERRYLWSLKNATWCILGLSSNGRSDPLDLIIFYDSGDWERRGIYGSLSAS